MTPVPRSASTTASRSAAAAESLMRYSSNVLTRRIVPARGSRIKGLPGGRRILRHPLAQVKAGVRGLVVRDVLPCDPKAVDRIVHQRDESMPRGCGRREDAQLSIVAGARNDLLTPVSQDVRG